MKKQELFIKKEIEKQLSERLKEVKTFNDKEFWNGYNPLEKIRGGLYHWVAVPFNGTDIFCELRCPNATQIEACGDISNITQELEKNKDFKLSYDDMIKIRNYQEELCKIVFNRPRFDEIGKLVGLNDFVISQWKKELEELQKQFEEKKHLLTEVEKKEISIKIKTLDLQLGFILPTDTMAFVTWWAMGNDVTQIKKITKESFLRAACLAKLHRKAPTDYISGVFTDYNKIEIDNYAIGVLEQFLEDQKIYNDTKHRWLLGGRKNKGSIPLPKKHGEK